MLASHWKRWHLDYIGLVAFSFRRLHATASSSPCFTKRSYRSIEYLSSTVESSLSILLLPESQEYMTQANRSLFQLYRISFPYIFSFIAFLPYPKAMTASSKSQDFHELFEITDKLGEGSFGQVYRCVHKENKKEFAVKMMRTSEVAETIIQDEIRICQKLDHRHIVKMVDFYVKDIEYFLMFEVVNGGRLFDDIVSRDQYSEFDACHCMEQILKGVEYLHKINIVHRDLKSKNILLTDKTKDAVVKIADFGAAGEFEDSEFFVFTGEVRSYYMSPELLSRGVCKHKVDIWSCGVLLYIMLVGHPPFRGLGHSLIEQMTDRQYSFTRDSQEDSLCDQAKDLIGKLLDPNPTTRMTATDALQHPFIRDRTTVTSRFHRQNTIEELKKHKAEIKDRWKRAVSAVRFMKASRCNKYGADRKNSTNTRKQDFRFAETISPRVRSSPPNLRYIGRSDAIDGGNEAETPSDAGQFHDKGTGIGVQDLSAVDLDSSNASATPICVSDTLGQFFDQWFLNSLRVILYPICLICRVLGLILEALRQNLK